MRLIRFVAASTIATAAVLSACSEGSGSDPGIADLFDAPVEESASDGAVIVDPAPLDDSAAPQPNVVVLSGGEVNPPESFEMTQTVARFASELCAMSGDASTIHQQVSDVLGDDSFVNLHTVGSLEGFEGDWLSYDYTSLLGGFTYSGIEPCGG